MSESSQHNRMALVSADDHVLIEEILNAALVGIEFEQTQKKLGQAQEVLLWEAQYMETADLVQRACDHPAQNIQFQKEIADLKAQQCLHPQSDHTEMKDQTRTLMKNKTKAGGGQ